MVDYVGNGLSVLFLFFYSQQARRRQTGAGCSAAEVFTVLSICAGDQPKTKDFALYMISFAESDYLHSRPNSRRLTSTLLEQWNMIGKYGIMIPHPHRIIHSSLSNSPAETLAFPWLDNVADLNYLIKIGVFINIKMENLSFKYEVIFH
ncbi:unnamed protein product, partial [Cuscuta epithymum]